MHFYCHERLNEQKKKNLQNLLSRNSPPLIHLRTFRWFEKTFNHRISCRNYRRNTSLYRKSSIYVTSLTVVSVLSRYKTPTQNSISIIKNEVYRGISDGYQCLSICQAKVVNIQLASKRRRRRFSRVTKG